MSFDLLSLALFAQADSAARWPWWWTLLLLCIALPIPALLGQQLAQWLRMKEYGWRLALIFCSFASAAVIVATGQLNLGVDLKGGVILVYEVDREALQVEGQAALDASQWSRLTQQIGNRINPAGTKEIVVRRYGEWQIEIIIPEVQDIEIDRIKNLISTAGALQFRIVANSTDHPDIISRAEEQAADPAERRSKYVRDGDREIGFWARVARETEVGAGGVRAFKVEVAGDIIRDATTGEILEVPPAARNQEQGLGIWLRDQEIEEIDVLMATDDGFNVTGSDLGMVSRSWDEMANPCVNFNMKGQGVGLMAGLTGSNLPAKDREFYRRLGIMLDGNLLSAPRVMSTISDRGRITGRFTEEEVEFLVGILQAGSLPAALKKEPISENKIGAVLGEMTIRQGRMAINGALLAVMVFMLVWYRSAGLIACAALLFNLLLILAFMILFKAAMTLPGMAGLVLTVGMSVDANVLIYERIREELRRGAAMRMAIRNGFDRALTAIVDSNVTTLITGIVLYAIGTDQIRGFAVTLILGILMSMFTAIFCARVAFDILERKRVLKTMNLRSFLPDMRFDFMGKARVCVVASLVLIGAGMVCVALRGKQILDIDFLGGSSVTMILEQPSSESLIRNKLDANLASVSIDGSNVQYSVNRVDVVGQQPLTVWKIDSSIPEVEQLEKILNDSFPLSKYSMTFGGLQEKRERLPSGRKTADPAETGLMPSLDPTAETPAEPPVAPAEKPEPTAEQPATSPAEPAAKSDAQAAPGEASPPQENAAPDSQSRLDLPPQTMTAAIGQTDFLLAQAESAPAETPAEPPPAPAEGQAEPAAPEEPPAAAAETPAAPEDEPSAAMEEEAVAPEEKPAAAPEEKPAAAPADEPAAPEEKPAAEEQEPAAAPAEPPATPAKEPAGPAAPDTPAEAPEETSSEASAEPTEEVVAERTVTTAELTFGHAINGRTVQDRIVKAATAAGLQWTEEDVSLSPLPAVADWRIDDAHGFKNWQVTVAGGKDEAQQVLDSFQKELSGTPVWPSSNKIGGKVAGDTRALAFAAIVFSLVGIVIYLWIRFERVVYGLAAVLAVVHDALFTLGAIAASYWLAGVLGFLQVQEFKISLSVVAALLTIIGYSLNDTIVIFDRIRELKGKSPTLTSDMLNLSINQTLSRTLLTGVTSWIVVLILYFFGGAGIHDFAFSLVIGVVVGIYSTVYVAAPMLLWMAEPKRAVR